MLSLYGELRRKPSYTSGKGNTDTSLVRILAVWLDVLQHRFIEYMTCLDGMNRGVGLHSEFLNGLVSMERIQVNSVRYHATITIASEGLSEY